MTLLQVSKLLKVSKQRAAQYESGAHYPSITLLMRLADVYGVSIDYLVGRVEAPDGFIFEPIVDIAPEVKTELKEMEAATQTKVKVPVGVHVEVATRKLKVAESNVQRAISAMEVIKETLRMVADTVPDVLNTSD